MLANQTCSLIEHGRIKTTLAKAKAVRPLAEKMVTLAKRGGLHARRRALALLHNNSTRTVKAVGKFFAEIAPRSAGRNGGYTRVVKLGPRRATPRPWLSSSGSTSPRATNPPQTKDTKSSKKASKPAREEDKRLRKNRHFNGPQRTRGHRFSKLRELRRSATAPASSPTSISHGRDAPKLHFSVTSSCSMCPLWFVAIGRTFREYLHYRRRTKHWLDVPACTRPFQWARQLAPGPHLFPVVKNARQIL